MDKFIKGGSFLVSQISPEEVYTPEEISDEHKMMAKTTASFVDGEVYPRIEALENQEEGLMAEMLRQAGELGLLGAEVPEEYGGLNLDKISTVVIAENVVRAGAFGVAFMAHTGIGTLPLVYFGTEEQKKRYLPGLASGEKIAAYALTEPGAGSDALNAKTKAVLSEDGKHYVLNGEKMFITNAAMANVIITYAKVDGDKFTAFIVDRATPGVSTGMEEKKLGIKGSSTRSVIFTDAKVPVENVLYEIGKGHVVAFNVLNIGRFKLAAGAVGSSKMALEYAVKYANERTQFNLPLTKFGLIKEKIGEMAVRIYAAESMAYRTGGMIDTIMGQLDDSDGTAGAKAAKAIEEYAIECSINKVFGSEVLDYVVDETVQIFGGYGYTQEYPAERMYRDARINRIFEGTNEINRLIIPGTLLRKANKGELPLLQAVQKLMGELMSPVFPSDDSSVLGVQKDLVERAKKICLMASGSAVQKYGTKLQFEQELLGRMADMIIEIFAMESALLRTLKAVAKDGEEAASTKVDLTKVYIGEAFGRIENYARAILAALEEGDMLRTQLSVLKKLARHTPENTIAMRRRIADRIIDANKYVV